MMSLDLPVGGAESCMANADLRKDKEASLFQDFLELLLHENALRITRRRGYRSSLPPSLRNLVIHLVHVMQFGKH